MTTDVDHLPPFTPVPARPAPPVPPEQQLAIPRAKRKAKKPAGKDPQKAKNGRAGAAVKKAAKEGIPKKAKPTKKPRKTKAAKEPTDIPRAPRVRSSRVAPLMLDAAAMLSTLAGLGKTEALTMRNIVEMLNPLARPARKRVLNAVLALMGN